MKTTLIAIAFLTASASLAYSKSKAPTTTMTKAENTHATHSTHVKPSPHSHDSYQKPGANIRFSHDLKHQITPGQSGSFALTLTEAYASGRLEVSLSAGEGLNLFSSSTVTSFDMASSDRHTMNVYFDTNADTPGRHYIGVTASVVDENGQASGRAYSVPVVVGDPLTHEKLNKTIVTADDGTGGRVIVMDAQETITTNTK